MFKLDPMALKSHHFGGSKVTSVTETKQTTLSMWVDRGFVHPTWQAPRGSGHRHEYSFEDMVRIILMKKLIAHGLSLGNASFITFGFRGDIDGISTKYVSEGIAEAHSYLEDAKSNTITWLVITRRQDKITASHIVSGTSKFAGARFRLEDDGGIHGGESESNSSGDSGRAASGTGHRVVSFF